jgi:major type 1 subunit fimbrin (pilin)
MKKALVYVAFSLSVLTAYSSAALADLGHLNTIEFEGQIKGNTCKINGGQGSFTVTLPSVSASDLAVAGHVAGTTRVDLVLSECTPDTGTVATYFEPGPSTNPVTGRLINDTGGATQVEVGLLNDAFGKINAAANFEEQNSQVVEIIDGKANLVYYAEYASLGSTTAGVVKTRVSYTLVYP